MKKQLSVAFVFPQSREWMFGVHQESLPSNSFYGSRELARLGLDVAEIQPSTRSDWRMGVLSNVERAIRRVAKVGITASKYLPQLDVLNQADVICATSDRPATAIAFLRALGLVRTPLVWWTMRLYDSYQNELPRLGRVLVRALLGQASRIVTLAGQDRRSALSEAFGISAEQVVSLHWGADTEYYSPSGHPGEEFIFTAGQTCRDFPLLFDAVTQSGIPVKMVAPIRALVGHDIPQNVYLIPGATLAGVKHLLDASRLVVVATLPNHFCAGQWTVISAMSMGKPVIWTEHRAADEYGLVHRANISLVDGNPGALLREIQWHLDNPEQSAEIGRAARRLAVQKRNMGSYARELLLVLNAMAESAGRG